MTNKKQQASPMITIAPTTPVTPKHHLTWALKALEDLARFVDVGGSAGAKANYCAAKREVKAALAKL